MEAKGKMNFKETENLDKVIEKLNEAEVLERMDEAKDSEDRNFWHAIYNRVLQLRQEKIINEKEFII